MDNNWVRSVITFVLGVARACTIIGLISLVYLRHVFIKRIGGITGDTVGAAIEIGETVLMFTFVVSYFYLV